MKPERICMMQMCENNKLFNKRIIFYLVRKERNSDDCLRSFIL